MTLKNDIFLLHAYWEMRCGCDALAPGFERFRYLISIHLRPILYPLNPMLLMPGQGHRWRKL